MIKFIAYAYALGAIMWVLLHLILIAVHGEVLIYEKFTPVLYSEIVLTTFVLFSFLYYAAKAVNKGDNHFTHWLNKRHA